MFFRYSVYIKSKAAYFPSYPVLQELSMNKISLWGLVCVLLLQNAAASLSLASENVENPDANSIVTSCPLNNLMVNLEETSTEIKSAYSCLEGKELSAIKLDKDKKFIARSLQPMDSDSPVGTIIDFEVQQDEVLFLNKAPSKIFFTGEIIENNPPRFAGRSSSLKLQIKKIKVDNVTYPAEAYISKMGKRNVMGGLLSGAPIYFMNLSDVANEGTITIDKVYKDPCRYSCESVKTIGRPFYYLGGALLQLADLLISPVVCFFMPGKEISIPENTAFEIKLENAVSLLDL